MQKSNERVSLRCFIVPQIAFPKPNAYEDDSIHSFKPRRKMPGFKHRKIRTDARVLPDSYHYITRYKFVWKHFSRFALHPCFASLAQKLAPV